MHLWAITSYFNPAHYRRRLTNFHAFRSRLRAPLAVVEFAVDGRFELRPDDADLVVRIGDGDVMWQKERLLAVAVSHLPPECGAVAWFDCDVVMEREDWVAAAERALQHVPLIQLFGDRFNLEQDVLPEAVADPSPYALGRSLAARLSEGLSPAIVSETGNVQRWRASLGLAWAGRRELIERHGFYDAGILGGGDRALAGAALGQYRAIAGPWCASELRVDHFRRWAEPFHQDVQGRIGFIEGRLYHLWHGERVHRGYLTRYEHFRQFDFDPDVDVRRSPGGAWAWSTPKPDMHAFVRSYFGTRREDG